MRKTIGSLNSTVVQKDSNIRILMEQLNQLELSQNYMQRDMDKSKKKETEMIIEQSDSSSDDGTKEQSARKKAIARLKEKGYKIEVVKTSTSQPELEEDDKSAEKKEKSPQQEKPDAKSQPKKLDKVSPKHAYKSPDSEFKIPYVGDDEKRSKPVSRTEKKETKVG